MSGRTPAEADPRAALLDVYDAALPHVYGYLLSRCGRAVLAEELTAETFLAAVNSVRKENVPTVSIPWLIGVARHKLVDHWRRRSRDDRNVTALAGQPQPEDPCAPPSCRPIRMPSSPLACGLSSSEPSDHERDHQCPTSRPRRPPTSPRPRPLPPTWRWLTRAGPSSGTSRDSALAAAASRS